MIGTVIAQRFEVIALAGTGAFAEVYCASDRVAGGLVALKFTRDQGPAALLSLRREAALRRELSHPNLVGVRGLMERDASCFLVMEWVDGVPINQWLRDLEDDTRAAATLDVIEQLESALSYLHARGIVHGDVKPDHALVDEMGRVVLIDFDLSMSLRKLGLAGESSHAWGGSPGYVAPEILSGDVATPASDVFSLGALVFELLTGEPAFGDEPSIDATLYARMSSGIATAPALAGARDRAVRMLSADPGVRPTLTNRSPFGGGATSPVSGTVGFGSRAEYLTAMLVLDERDTAFRSCVCVGASGLGKSTLVSQFAVQAHLARPGATWRSTCRLDVDVPFRGVDGWMDEICDAWPVGGAFDQPVNDDLKALSRLVPRLGHSDGTPAMASGEGISEAVRAFVRLVEVQAQRGPLRLWLDDAQWLDPDSAAFLYGLVDAEPKGVLLVVSSRESVAAWMPQPDVVVELEPLGPSDVVLWAQACGATRPRQTIANWVDATQGSPFLLALMLNAAPGVADLDPNSYLEALLRGFPDAAGRMLIALCVATRPVHRDVLLRFGGSGGDGAIEALRHARLVVEEQAVEGTHFLPSHDMLKRVVGRVFPQPMFRRAHAVLARAYLAAETPPAGPLAIHFRAAGENDQAKVWARHAAIAAQRTYAWNTAASWFETLLELEPTDSAAHIGLAEARTASGQTVSARAAWHRAAEHASDPEVELMAHLRSTEVAYGMGDVAGGHAALRPLLASVDLDWPQTRWRRLAGIVAWRARLWWWFARGRPRAASPVGVESRLDVAWVAAAALAANDTVLGLYFQVRHVYEALRYGGEAHRERALLMEFVFRASDARDNAATRWVEAEMATWLAGASEPESRARALWGLGYGAFIRGNIGDAAEHLHQASAHWASMERGGWEADHADRHLAWSYRFAARFGEMRELAERLARRSRRLGNSMLKDQMDVGPHAFCELLDDKPEAFWERISHLVPQRDGPVVLGFAVHRAIVDHTLYVGDAEAACEAVAGFERAMHEVRNTLHRRLEHPVHLCSAVALHDDTVRSLRCVRKSLKGIRTAKGEWATATRLALQAWEHWLCGRSAEAGDTWLRSALLYESVGMHGRALAARYYAAVTSGLDNKIEQARSAVALRGVSCPERWLRTELVGPWAADI